MTTLQIPKGKLLEAEMIAQRIPATLHRRGRDALGDHLRFQQFTLGNL